MKRWLWIALLLAGCQTSQPVATPVPTPVADFRIMGGRAVTRELVRSLKLVGTVAAAHTANPSADVSGRVVYVGVELGDEVHKGQVLIRLADAQARAQVQVSAAQVQVSRAQLEESLAKTGQGHAAPDVPPRLRGAAELPAVRKARANLDNAHQTYEDYLRLRAEELVSDQNVADKRAAYLSAKADYESALDQVQQDLAAVETGRAKVGSDKASLAQSQEKVSEAIIRSPYDGYVQQKGISVGDFLSAGSPSNLVLVSRRPLFINIDVPQEVVRELAPGAPVRFSCDAFPDRTLQARVRRFSPVVTATTRALQVQAEVIEAPNWLRPGMSVSVQLVTHSPQGAVLVPEAAVLTVSGNSQVFVVENGEVQARKVTTGQVHEGWVAVQGVKPGEMVAASDIISMKTGTKVVVGDEVKPPSGEQP